MGFFVMIAILIAGCVQQNKSMKIPESQNKSAKIITDKESCETLGGSWGKIGLSQEESCNLPTSDAGKECSDSGECEGSCIAELLQEDWNKAVQGVVYTKGKCTAWKITVGCHAFVESRKVQGILCVD